MHLHDLTPFRAVTPTFAGPRDPSPRRPEAGEGLSRQLAIAREQGLLWATHATGPLGPLEPMDEPIGAGVQPSRLLRYRAA